MWKLAVASATMGGIAAILMEYLLAQHWFTILVLRAFAWSSHLPWPPGGTLI